MSNSELVELIIVEGMIEAEIIKGKLESNGIHAHLRFESAGHIFGITMNGLGKVKVFVSPANHQKAIELISVNSFDSSETGPDDS